MDYQIDSSKKLNLKDFDAGDRGGLEKSEAEDRAESLGKELDDLLELLFAASQHSLLIVLQGIDTSGKDGAIRHLLRHSNAQSLKVWPFKVPTPEELAHDFLWRIHSKTPAKGNIAIFNRSHYEDVLVVRVHELVPKAVWEGRYDQINRFESLLASANTIIVKLFLHISKDEQEERLLAREMDAEKAWKLSVNDWKERQLWDQYADAFEAVFERCSSPEAPWTIVPSNAKWYRNLVVTQTLVDTLEPYRDRWLSSLEALGAEQKRLIDAYRQSAAAT